MQQHHRSSVVISALLTTLVMVLVAGGLLAYNGMLPLSGVSAQGKASQTTSQEAPIVVTVQPVLAPAMQQAAPAAAPSFAAASTGSASAGASMTAQSSGNDEVVAAYQAQLEEAYKALQDAYTQIDVLQNAQPQMAVATFHDDDNEHEGGESAGGERENGEGEHDDD